MIDATTLNLGDVQVPYLDNYCGLWAIRPESFFERLAVVQKMNISLHIQQHAQQASTTVATGGYGYTVDSDGIATVQLKGVLMKNASSLGGNTSTVKARRDVRALMEDSRVRGVMIVIDSPGGTVAGAYQLADDLFSLSQAKPTIAYIEDVGASAAFLMAAMCREIWASRTAEVAHIGTRMVAVDASAAATMEGLKIIPIDSGGMKSAGLLGTAITEEQKAYFQSLVNAANDHFVEAIARGRKMSTDEARKYANGKVMPAAEAMQAKLIDGVGSEGKARERMMKMMEGPPRGRVAGDAKPFSISIATGEQSIVFTASSREEAIQLQQEFASRDGTAELAAAIVDASTQAGGSSAGDPNRAQVSGPNNQGQGPEETSMSTTATPPATQLAAGTERKKPATITELRAAFPKDATFALDAAEKGMTLTEAKAAYADVLQKRLDEKDAELAKAKEQHPAPAAEPAKPPKRTGAEPVKSVAAESESLANNEGDAIERFNAAVTEQMKKPGCENRKKAIAAVCRADPDLHKEFLLATNNKAAKDAIEQRFAA